MSAAITTIRPSNTLPSPANLSSNLKPSFSNQHSLNPTRAEKTKHLDKSFMLRHLEFYKVDTSCLHPYRIPGAPNKRRVCIFASFQSAYFTVPAHHFFFVWPSRFGGTVIKKKTPQGIIDATTNQYQTMARQLQDVSQILEAGIQIRTTHSLDPV
jgi:hypothetical protein